MITHQIFRNTITDIELLGNELSNNNFEVKAIKLTNILHQYSEQQERQSELLELKNREIKLLKARLNYNDNDELNDVLFNENSMALQEVRKQIRTLEEELK